MLSADTLLDEETLMKILRLGHSRVPVHVPGNRQAILGILLVKELVLIDPAEKVPRSQRRLWAAGPWMKKLAPHCCCVLSALSSLAM